MKHEITLAVAGAALTVKADVRPDPLINGRWYGWVCYVITPPNGEAAHTFARTAKWYRSPDRALAAASELAGLHVALRPA